MFQFQAAAFGFVFVDEAGGKVGVDRHLLAGHGVQREARRDFGDAAGTFSDDDEIDDDQNGENDRADDVAVFDDERAEGFDHVTRCVVAGMAAF